MGMRLLELSMVLKKLQQQAADTDRLMLKDIPADVLPDKTKAEKTGKGNRFEREGKKNSKHVAKVEISTAVGCS